MVAVSCSLLKLHVKGQRFSKSCILKCKLWHPTDKSDLNFQYRHTTSCSDVLTIDSTVCNLNNLSSLQDQAVCSHAPHLPYWLHLAVPQLE
uniref:Uncharacterized protein n=1 Tax=Arundo donax TaxID=35708 RepID=A0A0A8XPV7_ARUDO